MYVVMFDPHRQPTSGGHDGACAMGEASELRGLREPVGAAYLTPTLTPTLNLTLTPILALTLSLTLTLTDHDPDHDPDPNPNPNPDQVGAALYRPAALMRRGRPRVHVPGRAA